MEKRRRRSSSVSPTLITLVPRKMDGWSWRLRTLRFHSFTQFRPAVPLNPVALRLGKVTFRWSISVRPVGVICRKVTNVSFFFSSFRFWLPLCPHRCLQAQLWPTTHHHFSMPDESSKMVASIPYLERAGGQDGDGLEEPTSMVHATVQ